MGGWITLGDTAQLSASHVLLIRLPTLGFQVMFLAGVSLLIGLKNAGKFFFGANKIKASGLFFGGIVTVLLGWSIIGMLIESVGLFYLFRSAVLCLAS